MPVGPFHLRVELSTDEVRNYQIRTTVGSLADTSLGRMALHELFGHVPLYMLHGPSALPYMNKQSDTVSLLGDVS